MFKMAESSTDRGTIFRATKETTERRNTDAEETGPDDKKKKPKQPPPRRSDTRCGHTS